MVEPSEYRTSIQMIISEYRSGIEMASEGLDGVQNLDDCCHQTKTIIHWAFE